MFFIQNYFQVVRIATVSFDPMEAPPSLENYSSISRIIVNESFIPSIGTRLSPNIVSSIESESYLPQV